MGTIGIQIGAKGAALLTSILFARALGPEEFGRYGFVIAIITIAVLPTVAGLPQLIVREISQYRAGKQGGLLLGILKWSNRYVLIVSLLSIFITYIFALLNFWEDTVEVLILSALLLIPLKGILARQGAVINGFRRPELAQLPTIVFAPVFALIISSSIYFLTNIELTSQNLVYIQLFAHIISAFLSNMIVNLVTKQKLNTIEPIFRIKKWHKALLPFTIITIVGVMNSELATVMLGFLGFEESVAYFRVAITGMIVSALSLTAVNSVSGPKIASLYKQKNSTETQNVLTQSVRLSSVIAIPVAIILIFWGEYLITFLFGKEYLPAATLLSILCVGQIFNVSTGSVGLVLSMTGNEKYALRAQIVNLILMILLLAFLVPNYQGIGAAIAVSIGMIFSNLFMTYEVFRLTGLKTWFR